MSSAGSAKVVFESIVPMNTDLIHLGYRIRSYPLLQPVPTGQAVLMAMILPERKLPPTLTEGGAV